jgi:hypothetical protein
VHPVDHVFQLLLLCTATAAGLLVVMETAAAAPAQANNRQLLQANDPYGTSPSKARFFVNGMQLIANSVAAVRQASSGCSALQFQIANTTAVKGITQCLQLAHLSW